MNLARLNSDGSVDPAFTANVSSAVNSLVVQPDGKVLICGGFTTVGGQNRKYIARVNSDGTVDTGFDPGVSADQTIMCMALQADGKIVIGGNFLNVGGQSRRRIARLQSGGVLDLDFNPGSGAITNVGGGSVYCALVQPDNKILIGGDFNLINGETRNYLARLESNGSVESIQTFNPGTGPGSSVRTMSQQVDGKIIIGGFFTSFNGTSRNRVARLNADGSLDSGFVPGSGANNSLSSVMVGVDGKILIAGDFTTCSGQPRNRIARLANHPVTQSLTTNNGSRAAWVRSGEAPEIEQVTFELSTNDGETWSALGFGSRVQGGWELAGLNLPSSGLLRARARNSNGKGGSGLVQILAAFPDGPEIVVEQPADTKIVDGGSRDLGGIDVGADFTLTFTIKSIGTADLTGLAITKDGPDAPQFTITSNPIAPLPGPLGATTFTVRFAPTSVGVKTATIHIASNDADENPFDITLTGVGKSLEPSFNPNVTGAEVLAVAPQPAGKVVLGGSFSTVGGQTRNHVARLLADGSVESTLTFDPGSGTNGPVHGAALQADGRVVIVGAFTTINGEPRNRIARLNPDGTLENTATFDPGTGADGVVHGLVIQADGQIVIAGDFTTVNGEPRNRIARLNGNGSVEGTGTFNAGSGADGTVRSVAVQADGRILLGGDFGMVNGLARTRLARLASDGTVEGTGTFDTGSGANGTVHVLAVQADGRILVGGDFTSVNGNARARVARLETNGAVESTGTFDPGTGADGTVSSIALQTDGKIFLGGSFATINALPRSGVARLNSNGTVEDTSSYNPGTGANGPVKGVALQSDGRILIGGQFTAINGVARNKLARFGNGPATQALAIPDSSVALWTRGGTSPEVEHATVELSTNNGVTWTPLGPATRITGGWQKTGLTLPATGMLRARGRSIGGHANASSGLVEITQTFSNPPMVTTETTTAITATTATLNGTLNPNGSSTVWFEYGPTTSYGSTTPVQNISGAGIVAVQADVTGLTGNAGYHVRMVASNAAGTVPGTDVAFTTAPDPPFTITGAPTAITSSSATLVGSVNPKGRETTAWFAYGPTALYGSTTPVQNIPAGASAVDVTAALSGLVANSTYHFRLYSSSSGGNAEGDDVSFVTNYPAPQAVTGAASILSTTSARVNGTVRAFNASTQVFFDYGTDGVSFPFSVSATPPVVTADVVTNVSADLTNLLQGVNYHYRVRAVSAGGTTTGSSATLALAILSGLTQAFPPLPPPAEGFVVVNLSPSSIGAGWRFVGEQAWRNPGAAAGGLTTGDRMIEFRPVAGWIQPPRETVGVVSEEGTTVVSREYYLSTGTGTGGLATILKPDSIADSGVALANRAQWRFVGESDSMWRDSGTVVTGLRAGSYLIECKAVPGRTTPSISNVVVSSGQTATPVRTYFIAEPTTGTAPVVLPFSDVSEDETMPYAYVGQIRSDAGSSTGFVVKNRVVATAGHVVWDDGTLSATQGLQWLFQRHRAVYEPKPLIPRGFYLFDGYSAQRILDNSPGQSSPQSQHLDVAALYFDESAGRGGYGGFLASDLDDNEFLLSNSEKILVGYPVTGISTTNQGRMHATPSLNVDFDRAFGRTFSTAGIRSFGGNSGGPLCVQHSSGAFYPAAIYLGGSNQTVVRAIDSAVIELFNRAETSGGGGGNNTGGGITHTSVSGPATANPGSLKVLIEPPGAVSAGAGWRIAGVTNYLPSGNTKSNLTEESYTLEFVIVAGYEQPVSVIVPVTGGQLTTITYTYALPMTAQESWRQTFFGTTSNTGDAADSADPDGDGFTNGQEYAAGTNPTVSGDFFQASNPSKAGNSFTVSTAGKAGRTYALERNSTPAAGGWTTVASQGPLASNVLVTLNDTSSPPGSAFYRIRVTGP